MTPKGRGRGAGGLRGLDAVPPSAPSSTTAGEQQEAEQDTAERTPARRPATVTPKRLEPPAVEIPRNERSNRTAQLNFRVTDQTRDYVQRQLKLIAGETGLRDNQVSAIAVQVLVDSIGDIRHRAMLTAGQVDADE